MRVRFSFAGAFFAILFLAAYTGLLPNAATPSPYLPNDKLLHLVTFFFLTIAFYFILDVSRRRVLNLTLLICTFILGIGSEIIQGFLINGRTFDPYDIVANLLGSLSACGLASLYHKRMLERRRKAKYSLVGGEGGEGDVDEDLELGEGSGTRTAEGGEQETRVINNNSGKSLEDEVDNWDENAVDEAWEEDDVATAGKSDSTGKMTPPSSNADDEHEMQAARG